MDADAGSDPRPDPELLGLLRKEAGFARNLAKSLLFDDQLADDVVQQAWLTAIERPPAHRVSVRGWFLTVVRNLALKALRSRKRRTAREERAARLERVESTADSVEREHVLRAMTDAVLALDEPYRHTILARFFDDLPPRVIAERDGVPVATVQSRITRGLAKLREHLGHERGGNASRLALGLLAFADPARFAALTTPTATPAPVDVSAPTWTTHAPWLVPASIATVAIIVVTTLFVGGDDVSPPLAIESTPRAKAPRESRLDAIEAELDTGARDPAGPKTRAGAPPIGLARDATALRVLVRRQADGAPADRIAVRCIEWSRPNARWVAVERVTDDDGYVWFTHVVPGLVTLVLDRGGRADVTVAESTWNDAFVWLPLGVEVHGRVLTPSGQAAARARVWLSGGIDDVAGRVVAVAADDGTFALHDIAPERMLAALDARLAPSDVVAIAPTRGAIAAIELVLREHHASLEGRVRAPDGSSIAGAQIELESLDLRRPAIGGDPRATIPRVPPVTERTAIDGTFRAGPLAPGRYSVRVRAAGFAAWSSETHIESGAGTQLAIELGPGARIDGRVTYADGTPARNVECVAAAATWEVSAARSDAEGRFTLTDVPSGTVTARASSNGGVETAEFRLQATERVEWNPRLARGRFVRGLVRDLRATPVAVELRAIEEAPGSSRAIDVDPAGRFSVELRDGASAWLELRDGSSPLPLAHRLVRADDDGLELVVPAEPGRITFEPVGVGETLTSIAIALEPVDAVGRSVIVGATIDGRRVVLEDIPDGSYRMTASVAERAPVAVDSVVVRAGATAALGAVRFEACGELRLETTLDTTKDARPIDVLDAHGALV
ncbi:MAG: sigma-70 family RNA polymerase sigma factor, partial [Planctomycetes bacterium]|nr:sigma-70 family RNA polymerase sigma factor [Planctomycetota bacterium]